MSKIDELDLEIIEILQEDGTLTNTAIAEQLGVSEATVRRRQGRLRKDDVIRVVAVANPFKIGLRIMAVVAIQVEKNRLRDIEQALAEMPEVRFLGVTLGGYDLMLEAWFGSSDDLLHFATVTLGEVKGILRTDTFRIMRLSKYTYDWGKPSASRSAPLSNGFS